jgi:hypothetical protein
VVFGEESRSGAGVSAIAVELVHQQEEEELTNHHPKERSGEWEFKILRSNFQAFRKPERLRAVLEEEKRGGWVLVEKFDDSRIRLRRSAGFKAPVEDLASGYDPYRTYVDGLNSYLFIGAVIGILFVCLTMFLLIVSLTAR